MTTRYETDKSRRQMVVAVCAMAAAIAVFALGCVAFGQTHTTADTAGALAVAALALIPTALMLYFDGPECWAVYMLDDEGISKATWRGERRIEWASVIRYTATGTVRPTYRLWDGEGPPLKVPLDYLRRHAQEIEGVFKDHLAPLADRALADIREHGRTWYPDRKVGTALFAAFALVAASTAVAAALSRPDATNSASDLLFTSILFVTLGIASLVGAAFCYVHRISIDAQAAVEQTLLGTKRVQLAEVETITARRRSNHGVVTETLVLAAGATKVTIGCTPEYRLVRQFIREAAPQARFVEPWVLPEEPVARQREVSRRSRLQWASLGVLALMALVPCAIAGRVIQRENALYTRGIEATARVTAVEHDRVCYEFATERKHFTGRSPVAPKTAEGFRPGDAVDVAYLPEDPSVSHATVSNAMGRMAGILIPTLLTLALLVVIVARGARRKPIATAAAAPPVGKGSP